MFRIVRNNDSIIYTGEKTMNRKLSRLIMLVVTVLLALAITAPALADPPILQHGQWEGDYPLLDCDRDDVYEIRVYIQANWLARGFEYDENGELVSIFFHVSDKYHIYNKDYPELSIDGIVAGSDRTDKIHGWWGTGVSFNFHAPGYPQIAHVSGYWMPDEEGNPVFIHGRVINPDVDVICELLTPP
jgi:hypothetical protein